MFSSLSISQRERTTQLAALALCIVFALMSLMTLVRLVWLFVPRDEQTMGVPAATTRTADNTAAVSVGKWHLFGNPAEGVVLSQSSRKAPNTTLKLSLHGTLALENPKTGMAMIADDAGEHAYHVGEMVADNTRLDSVYVDRVIIVHEGVAETLELPKPEEHSAAAPAAPSTGTQKNAAAIAPLYVPPVAAAGAVDWKQVQQKYNVDPEELKKNIQVLPVMENGVLAGVRLSAGPNAALFNKLGLQSSDVVTAVNGIPVNNLSNAQQLMDSVKNNAQIQVTVKRDGKPATLTVSLK